MAACNYYASDTRTEQHKNISGHNNHKGDEPEREEKTIIFM